MSSDSKSAEDVIEDKIQTLKNEFDAKLAELKVVADNCISVLRKDILGWQYEALRFRNMVLKAPTHVAAALFDDDYATRLENLAKHDAMTHPEVWLPKYLKMFGSEDTTR